MSILASPPLPCVDCGLPTTGECQACDDPLCARCEEQNRGWCRDCAQAEADYQAACRIYERSVL